MMFPLVIGILSAIKDGSFTPINPVSLFDASSVGEYFNSANTDNIQDESAGSIDQGERIGYWLGDRGLHEITVGIGGTPNVTWGDNQVSSDRAAAGYVFGCNSFGIDAATTSFTWGGCFSFSGSISIDTLDLVWPTQDGTDHRGGVYINQSPVGVRFEPTQNSSDIYVHDGLNDGLPHMVAMSYDQPNNLIRFWVDGENVQTITPVGSVFSPDGIYSGLGNTNNIDSRKMWKLFAIDKELSSSQMYQLYLSMVYDAYSDGNDVPFIVMDSVDSQSLSDSSVDITLSGFHSRGEGITYEVASNTADVTATISGETLTLDPAPLTNDTSGTVTLIATDGVVYSEEVSFSVDVEGTGFYDTFTSSSAETLDSHDPDIGQGWLVDAGITATVDGGILDASSSSNQLVALADMLPIDSASITSRATLPSSLGAERLDLVLRYEDIDNYVTVRFIYDTGLLAIASRDAGSFSVTSLSGGYTYSAGDEVEVIDDITGDIKVYVNGVLEFEPGIITAAISHKRAGIMFYSTKDTSVSEYRFTKA